MVEWTDYYLPVIRRCIRFAELQHAKKNACLVRPVMNARGRKEGHKNEVNGILEDNVTSRLRLRFVVGMA